MEKIFKNHKKLLLVLLVGLFIFTGCSGNGVLGDLDDSNDVYDPFDGEEKIESNVEFDFLQDIRVFTLFSFMNYTGYDRENYDFHELRIETREALDEMDIDIINDSYFLDKDVQDYYYLHLLARLSGPEDGFEPLDNLPTYGPLEGIHDLPEHLNDFYKAVGEDKINSLFEKHQEYANMSSIKRDFENRIKYLNYYLDENPEMSYKIMMNYMDSHQTGSGARYHNYLDEKLAVVGPFIDRWEGLTILSHEYLHSIITPMSNDLSDLIYEYEYLHDEIEEGTQAYGYPNWLSVVDETIINSIDYREIPTFDDEDMKRTLNRQNFILGEYFIDRFTNDWEDFDGDLKSFYEKILIELEDHLEDYGLPVE